VKASWRITSEGSSLGRLQDLAGRRVSPGAGAIVGVPTLAAVTYLAYGQGFVNGDTLWALIRGEALAHLRQPTSLGATPHPLLDLAAALLSPLGQEAEPAWHVLGYLSIGALLYATWLLGATLFGRWAGVLAAGLVASRATVALYGPLAYPDLPYAALVIWAVALEAKTPRRGTPVLLLLTVAGLLRPEAWILAGLYWLWLLPTLDRAKAVRAFLLITLAPVVWVLSDLVVFGDPTFSFTHTTRAAIDNRRPHGVADLITHAPRLLGQEARPAVVIVAGIGYLLALRYSTQGRRLVAWTAATGLAFSVPVAAGTVVNPRYLLPTLVLVCVAAAGSITGWSGLIGRPRSAWQVGALVGVLVLLVTAPSQIRRVSTVRDDVATYRTLRDRFQEVVKGPIPCLPLTFANARPYSMVVFWTGLDPHQLRNSVDGASPTGTYLWGTLDAMTGVTYLPTDATRPLPPPSGARVVRRQHGWTVSERCA
jgi:hypothetical protein